MFAEYAVTLHELICSYGHPRLVGVGRVFMTTSNNGSDGFAADTTSVGAADVSVCGHYVAMPDGLG